VLDIRESEFLVLLLVIQAQHYTSSCFLAGAARKKSVHLLVNVCAERKNFIEQRPRKRRPQAFIWNLLAERVVIAIEKPMKLFPERFVVLEEGTQNERFKKPGGMSLVPLHRAGFRTRLHHLIFGRKACRQSTCRRPYSFVSGSDCGFQHVASNSEAVSL